MTTARKFTRAIRVRSDSFDADTNTVQVVWSTGASVRRCDPWTGDEFDEVLSMDPDAVRLARLNAGAPFLDAHDSTACGKVIGSVVPGSASINGGRGVATVQLSRAAGDRDIVGKIADGIIRNVSVGYWVHSYTKEESDVAVPLWTATDWEPLEISAVPIPADAGAQIRSLPGRGATSPAPTSLTADIRRIARKAGCEELGEEHIRAGTSAREFSEIAAGQVSGNRAPWSADLASGNSVIERKVGKRHWEAIAKRSGIGVRKGPEVKPALATTLRREAPRLIGGTKADRADYEKGRTELGRAARRLLGKV